MKMQEDDAHQLQSEKEILENLTARLFHWRKVTRTGKGGKMFQILIADSDRATEDDFTTAEAGRLFCSPGFWRRRCFEGAGDIVH